MSSDLMDYLRKDRGEIFFNLLTEGFGQVLPETFGSDEHLDERISCIRAVSSCRACGATVVLSAADSSRPGAEVREGPLSGKPNPLFRFAAASRPHSSCFSAGPLHQYSLLLSCLRKRVATPKSRMTHGRECRGVWPSGSAQAPIRYLNNSAEESTIAVGLGLQPGWSQ